MNTRTKNPISPLGMSDFLSKPQGLAYHHDRVVHIIAVGVYHHRRCIPLRLDDIQHCVLMIYRNKLRMICNGKAVDFLSDLSP